jgi:hypothetical protein
VRHLEAISRTAAWSCRTQEKMAGKSVSIFGRSALFTTGAMDRTTYIHNFTIAHLCCQSEIKTSIQSKISKLGLKYPNFFKLINSMKMIYWVAYLKVCDESRRLSIQNRKRNCRLIGSSRGWMAEAFRQTVP